MVTEQLYYADSYLQKFEAIVADVRPDGVILDRSAFYPLGGGQPCDTGELRANGQVWPVVAVKRQGAFIVHRLDGVAPSPGTSVRGVLDWDLRYRYMRLHTALHALSGVVWIGWKADVTGSHIYDDGLRARMDFSLEAVRINELRDEIERRLNDELEAAREIRAYELPRAEALTLPDLIRTHVNLVPEHIARIRIVEIQGLDRQADGGTHVANTREVGRVMVTNAVNKGRINRRLEIALVERTDDV